jgi:MoaA/NifB/PqqE/SkfB family radical SAM enzyme
MMVISGFRVRFFFLKLHIQLLFFLIRKFGFGNNLVKKWKEINQYKQQFTVSSKFHKYIKHNNRVYLNCNIPGLPFTHFFERISNLTTENQINELSRLAIVQIGFTKKCPLNCEHCYEGKILNQSETVSLSEHKKIVKKLQQNGVPMIQFGGGEPLNRLDDLIEVLKFANDTSDFWIYSSGYGLTLDKALKLKQAGLTGISISIDHFLESEHNAFRRNEKSYNYAIEAVKNAQKVGLLTALTICVTKSFCSVENLDSYHRFAFDLKVPFVQLMEPRATGNYEDMDVSLTAECYQILESFYISRTSEKFYKHLPIIQYTGYQQRKKSCGGAGNRYIYIDTDGFVLSCPFCKNRKSHFLYGNTSIDLQSMRREGCELVQQIES